MISDATPHEHTESCVHSASAAEVMHAVASAPKAAPTLGAISDALLAKINAAIDSDAERLTAIFKGIHQNPELGFTETRTAAIVAKELKALGFKVTEGIAKTGVVGVLENGKGPTVWYRADMDALPVNEASGLPYASKTSNIMHACGHDAHVTWLLGLANAMVTLKSEWSGTLVLYGQPAEEPGTGAKAMVADKVWERGFPEPDYALAMHTLPAPVGTLICRPGEAMAGFDRTTVTFTGRGAHGSMPHLSIDPVVMAAQAVLSYQTIISRNVDPREAAVVTIGCIEAGTVNNVIPPTATLKMDMRFFKDDVHQLLLKRIDEINRGIAIAAGVPEEDMPTRKSDGQGNANPEANDAALITRLGPSLQKLLGAENFITNLAPMMGSEDFQELYQGRNTPYALMWVGVAPKELFEKARSEGKQFPYINHTPDFFVDLTAIPMGARINTTAVMNIMAK